MTNTELIRGGYASFSRGDIPGVLALFADHIVWTSPDSLPTGGCFRGKDQVLGFFQRLPQFYDELIVEPETYLEAGDTVLVRGRHRARIGDERVVSPFAMLWTVRDGKVTEFFEYNDTAAIARALDKKKAHA